MVFSLTCRRECRRPLICNSSDVCTLTTLGTPCNDSNHCSLPFTDCVAGQCDVYRYPGDPCTRDAHVSACCSSWSMTVTSCSACLDIVTVDSAERDLRDLLALEVTVLQAPSVMFSPDVVVVNLHWYPHRCLVSLTECKGAPCYETSRNQSAVTNDTWEVDNVNICTGGYCNIVDFNSSDVCTKFDSCKNNCSSVVNESLT